MPHALLSVLFIFPLFFHLSTYLLTLLGRNDDPPSESLSLSATVLFRTPVMGTRYAFLLARLCRRTDADGSIAPISFIGEMPVRAHEKDESDLIERRLLRRIIKEGDFLLDDLFTFPPYLADDTALVRLDVVSGLPFMNGNAISPSLPHIKHIPTHRPWVSQRIHIVKRLVRHLILSALLPADTLEFVKLEAAPVVGLYFLAGSIRSIDGCHGEEYFRQFSAGCARARRGGYFRG